MALEAVVFPQELFRHPMAGGPWFYDMAGVEEDAGNGEGGAVDVINGDHQMGDNGSFTSSGAEKSPEQGPGELDDGRRGSWEYPSSCSSEEPRDVTNSSNADDGGGGVASFPAAAGGVRRKRQRARRCRNREEVENQRMTHIAVERNRRRQMNEYLAELRSLMPPSYIQKGDQASIVGGAINFVKELEQLLQSLEAQKRTRQQPSGGGGAADGGSAISSLFGGFFTFPQYYSSSPSSKSAATTTSSTSPPHCHPAAVIISDGAASPATGKVDAAAAASAPDVEVTMVESHASLKVLSRRRRRPGQLLDVVAGLQGLRLTTLHLNVTTVGDVLALYSFSLKVEDDCQLSSANEIAAAVHQMLAGADVPGNSPSPASTQQPSSSPAAMGAVVERRRD